MHKAGRQRSKWAQMLTGYRFGSRKLRDSGPLVSVITMG